MNVLKLTEVIGFDFAHAGTDLDRGCVRCKGKAIPDMPGLILVDDRGRYWHARCAAITLAEFTRFEETRGERFHYERNFDIGGEESVLVGAKRRIAALEAQIAELQRTMTFTSDRSNYLANEFEGRCSGGCSRGGDGPPCGKQGCQG